MRFAIFASGSGSNFQAIMQALAEDPAFECVLLFCDQAQAYVVERASQWGVPCVVASPRDFEDREAYESYLAQLCLDHQVDYILLAGYMRQIHQPLLEAYEQRIVNLHPSLLPAFPGRHAIDDAWNYGVKVTGVTLHWVDAGIDSGKIIAQEPVVVADDDTLESLEAKIHAIEHRLYPQVIRELMVGRFE